MGYAIRERELMLRRAFLVLIGAVALLVGAFFAFVGAMKTFAPLAILAENHAWTVRLPEAFGRAVGVSELLCAAMLVVPVAVRRWRGAQRLAAWVLVANQLLAAAVHAAAGEGEALPQNALLIALLLIVAFTARSQIYPRQARSFK